MKLGNNISEQLKKGFYWKEIARQASDQMYWHIYRVVWSQIEDPVESEVCDSIKVNL